MSFHCKIFKVIKSATFESGLKVWDSIVPNKPSMLCPDHNSLHSGNETRAKKVRSGMRRFTCCQFYTSNICAEFIVTVCCDIVLCTLNVLHTSALLLDIVVVIVYLLLSKDSHID